jgi:transposase
MQKGGYTTVAEHLSAAHRAHMEWTPERLIHWGETIGVATGRFVSKLLHMRRHPEHGYRACLGLFSLAKRYGKTRLEAACLLALELGVTKCSHVRDILANNRDQVCQQDATQWTSPEHEHVRGPSYYQ